MSESETNEMQDLGQLYFKEEENMKKIICCLIALVLCLGVLPVSAEETAEPKTKYLNSIVSVSYTHLDVYKRQPATVMRSPKKSLRMVYIL